MKRKNYYYVFFMLFGNLLILFVACSKNDDQEIELPVVRTIEVANIIYNQVTVKGIIISNGGDSIIEQGVCWGLLPNPTISDFSEKNTTGFTNDYSIVLKKLVPNTNYYVRAYVTNIKGVSYGEELTFILWLNKPDEPVTDIDNNSYSTIRIGDQIWMKENLKVAHYRNGDLITNITLLDDTEWLKTNSGAYCAYDDAQTNVDKYGYLYNGYAVTDERSICPDGWHIPTKEEWQRLIDYLGGYNTAGNLLKYNADWDDLPPNTTNLSGFTALPGGLRWHSMSDRTYTEYSGINKQAYFATSDEYTYNDICYMWYANVMNLAEWARVSDNTIKTCGQSVRCIRD